jgi:hypothetical protein
MHCSSPKVPIFIKIGTNWLQRAFVALVYGHFELIRIKLDRLHIYRVWKLKNVRVMSVMDVFRESVPPTLFLLLAGLAH